ncbi:MAG: energy-coupling factor ABC transporter ATP-binding protein [Halodesulfurarchaeum sp.]
MSLLTARDLSVEGPDGTRLLDSISLSIDRGETVLLAGPSGSGKSLLGMGLGGLLEDRPALAVTGQVRRAGSVGVLFQNPKTQLVRRTVRSDVAFGLENRGVEPSVIRDRIESWAGRLDAAHLLDRDIETLSRGETTLVALLGILVTEPDLIVLDEPLSSLDARNRELVLETIDELQRQTRTGLLVTEHDASALLERADRALVLESGAIVDAGAPRAVLGSLREAGIDLPFGTAVALEREEPVDRVPLSG